MKNDANNIEGMERMDCLMIFVEHCSELGRYRYLGTTYRTYFVGTVRTYTVPIRYDDIWIYHG